ncbi:MAG: glycerophosphodiester phosphodiesterase [Candidatus Thorarchaeota archaeon]
MTAPIVIGHKGASGHAPENTLLSFKRAFELGAQMIELDVHETIDGELVCIHDSTVDRTTNGTGEVHQLTYKELLALDAGEGESIPLLTDVLKFASGRLQVNVELKVIGVEQKLLDMIDQLKMHQDVIISSFYHGTLNTIREFSNTIQTAILVNTFKKDLVLYALDNRVNAINPLYELVTPGLVNEAHHSTLKVYPWTVNDTHVMRELIAIGVDGVITDFPDKLASILREQDY